MGGNNRAQVSFAGALSPAGPLRGPHGVERPGAPNLHSAGPLLRCGFQALLSPLVLGSFALQAGPLTRACAPAGPQCSGAGPTPPRPRWPPGPRPYHPPWPLLRRQAPLQLPSMPQSQLPASSMLRATGRVHQSPGEPPGPLGPTADLRRLALTSRDPLSQAVGSAAPLVGRRHLGTAQGRSLHSLRPRCRRVLFTHPCSQRGGAQASGTP
ncbi:hypothetical protein NDU88_005350 [Pleurodeles waltl]|uniref:Uncharacterized protein n=1 Tax=Pleurodeles waltl TaxID=8319 RepID=A0AAV7NM80_PLEWA|nr:hypothetical protein NDU88_005350 [Pleurodeles waltl]